MPIDDFLLPIFNVGIGNLARTEFHAKNKYQSIIMI